MRIITILALACACAFARTTIEPSGNSFIVTTDVPNATNIVATFTCSDGATPASWAAELATGQWTSVPNPCAQFASVAIEPKNARGDGYGYRVYRFTNGGTASITISHMTESPVPQFAPVWVENLMLIVFDAEGLDKLDAAVLLQYGDEPAFTATPKDPIQINDGKGVWVWTPADGKKPHKLLGVQLAPATPKVARTSTGQCTSCTPHLPKRAAFKVVSR